MTDEQLNVALCEWLGWKPFERERGDGMIVTKWRLGHEVVDELPNHIHGLEALGHVHEAEKRLTEEQQAEYALMFLAPHIANADGWSLFDVAHKTAREKVECLLRVVRPEVFNADIRHGGTRH